MPGPTITVIGSLNTDICVRVPRLPSPGETVLGSGAVIGPGGKGANQAVAAARLGARVRLHGCVGADEFAGTLVCGLRSRGVDTRGLRVAEGAVTGLALISVDESGENAITVAPGANALLGEQDVNAALAHPCDVVLLSAEIGVAALAAALMEARRHDVPAVLNLAPVPAAGRDLLAARPQWLVLNAREAASLLGADVHGLSQAEQAAATLAGWGPGHVVVTLGIMGAVLASSWDTSGQLPVAARASTGQPVSAEGATVVVPAFGVRAVDTVGAGDAFCGALAVAVGAGIEPERAVRAACAVAATATTRRGAQAAMPDAEAVLAATGLEWPVPCVRPE
jgi:ribokinase